MGINSNDSLWIEQENANLILEGKTLNAEIQAALESLMRDGVCVLRGANDRVLCQEAINDYKKYCRDNQQYVNQNLDDLDREKRLVNFHLLSDAAMRIGVNPLVMNILDELFECETGIYTSLTFKYGTQQPVHRDTPHFSTTPKKRFAGVWTALEDIDPTSGPIFYHPGAHKFAINPEKYLAEAFLRWPNEPIQFQLKMALDLYNGEIIRTAPTISEAKILLINAGDTVIWHPEMPHGGSLAENPFRTRFSIVFHNTPKDVQVYQYEDFFQQAKNVDARYGFQNFDGRKIALSGNTAFM